MKLLSSLDLDNLTLLHVCWIDKITIVDYCLCVVMVIGKLKQAQYRFWLKKPCTILLNFYQEPTFRRQLFREICTFIILK